MLPAEHETLHPTIDTEQSAEERRLWADFYEATARVVELIRREGTDGEVVPRIVAQEAIARAAFMRIKQIRGIAVVGSTSNLKREDL